LLPASAVFQFRDQLYGSSLTSDFRGEK